MSLEVEILNKTGEFARENSPFVNFLKDIVSKIDFEGKNHSDRAKLVYTEL